jgi:hypothetical protein
MVIYDTREFLASLEDLKEKVRTKVATEAGKDLEPMAELVCLALDQTSCQPFLDGDLEGMEASFLNVTQTPHVALDAAICHMIDQAHRLWGKEPGGGVLGGLMTELEHRKAA